MFALNSQVIYEYRGNGCCYIALHYELINVIHRSE
jgi:hypothetical protein